MKKHLFMLVLLFPALVSANEWSYQNGPYASLETKVYEVNGSKAIDSSFKFHLMHFHQNNELITSFTLPKNYSYICGSSSGITFGDYRERDIGLANINGTFVKFVAVCNANHNIIYNKKTSKNEYKFNWEVEFQPTTAKGSKYILSELTANKDLRIKWDIIYNQNSVFYQVYTSNFVTEFKKIESKLTAL